MPIYAWVLKLPCNWYILVFNFVLTLMIGMRKKKRDENELCVWMSDKMIMTVSGVVCQFVPFFLTNEFNSCSTIALNIFFSSENQTNYELYVICGTYYEIINLYIVLKAKLVDSQMKYVYWWFNHSKAKSRCFENGKSVFHFSITWVS